MSATPVIHPIGRDAYLLSVIAAQKTAKAAGLLHASVKSHLSKAELMRRLQSFAEKGTITSLNDVRLTAEGWRLADRDIGLQVVKAAKDAKDAKKILTNHVFPALAFGFRPDSNAGRRIKKGSELRAVLLTRIYELPLDGERVTLAQALGSLAKRRLAGLGPSSMDPRLSRVADNIPDLTEIDSIRSALLTLALEPDGESELAAIRDAAKDVKDAPKSAIAERPRKSLTGQPTGANVDDVNEFARRVLQVAAQVSTPPFAHKASVAQVYDEFGRRFPDAGTLSSFHARLLHAHLLGRISLLPLDQPGSLASDTYQRSRIETPDGPAYFVDRRDA